MLEIHRLRPLLSKFLRIRSCHSQISGKSRRDTIFALSSGFGKCGVAVIRVSGPNSSEALKHISGLKEFKPRYAHLRSLRHPNTKELIDKGLVLWFPGPHSFSGEDSCEFQIHGGPAVISAMLNALSALKGYRPAEPGEFTKRAFFAGKLDLTEVEGLADLIHAETEAQRKQALIQATGSLSKVYSDWRQRILRNVAHVEAYIDFAEDENIEDDTMDNVYKSLTVLGNEIKSHLQDGRKGERLRQGVRTAIIGAPNVGKSSLINILCQKPVSIVTDIAGTTRDIIESHFNIGDYPVLLADTAGLRNETSDIVENEGITRAKNYLSTVDFILMLIDAQYLVKFRDFDEFHRTYIQNLGLSLETISQKNIIYIVNKVDLVSLDQLQEKCKGKNTNFVSCLTDYGIPAVIQTISNHLKELCGNPSFEHPILSNARQRHHLCQALADLNHFLSTNISDEMVDLALLAQSLRSAVRSIGKITGEVGTEEILDVIFRDFCIGK